MLVDKEVVYHYKLRDAGTKVILEVRANKARLEVGYGDPVCIIDFDVESPEEQRSFVETAETTLETCLSAMEFFFKLLTHPHIPDYFGRTTK